MKLKIMKSVRQHTRLIIMSIVYCLILMFKNSSGFLQSKANIFFTEQNVQTILNVEVIKCAVTVNAQTLVPEHAAAMRTVKPETIYQFVLVQQDTPAILSYRAEDSIQVNNLFFVLVENVIVLIIYHIFLPVIYF